MAKPDEQDTAAEVASERYVHEQDPLYQHRYRAAKKAGMSRLDAHMFAVSRLDTHDLEDLIRKGCEPHLALRILL